MPHEQLVEEFSMPIDPNTFPVSTITQFVGGDWGEDIFALAYLSGGAASSITRIAESSTSYTLQNDYFPTRTTIYEGTGFTYDADGALTGTITSITYMDGATVLAVMSFENLNAQTFDLAINDMMLGDFAAFDAMFGSYQFVFDASSATGAVGGDFNVPGKVNVSGIT
mgnify:CR=1 FL=1